MARSNGSRTLVHWKLVEANAPYRASINGDCHWDVMAPDPNLAAAMRVSPGGRLLAAFEHAEVRDFFVDGHLPQGAQPEPDFASRARARQRMADPALTDLESIQNSFEAANNSYSEADEATRSADKALELFARDWIRTFKAEGKIQDALRLRNALPGDTMAKVLVLDMLRPLEPSQVSLAGTAPMTPELAALSLTWQRAHRRERALADAITETAGLHGRQLFAEGKSDELSTFIASIRYPIARAFLIDMQRHSKPASDATETPSP